MCRLGPPEIARDLSSRLLSRSVAGCLAPLSDPSTRPGAGLAQSPLCGGVPMEELEAILAAKDPHLHVIEPDAPVIDAVEKMCGARVGALLVMEGKALLGIFSERDLMTRVLLSRRDPATTRVKDVMTHRAICVGVGAAPREAMVLMTNRRV